MRDCGESSVLIRIQSQSEELNCCVLVPSIDLRTNASISFTNCLRHVYARNKLHKAEVRLLPNEGISMKQFSRHWVISGSIIFVSFATGIALKSQSGEPSWSAAGQNLHNTRSQPDERAIGPANVASLTMKWTFTTGADVSATPTVAGDAVYFPDWSGNLYAVRKDNG
jgi:PQQ-like domain